MPSGLPSVPPAHAGNVARVTARRGVAPSASQSSSWRRAFFRNITRWGPVAEDYLRKHSARYDFIAMSELHLAADELLDALKVRDSAGFNAAGTPARPLGTFLKTGGVVAGVRKNFQSSSFRHLAAYEDQMLGAVKLPGLPLGPIDFWDFVPVSWRIRGLNIVAIAAYLTSCGELLVRTRPS